MMMQTMLLSCRTTTTRIHPVRGRIIRINLRSLSAASADNNNGNGNGNGKGGSRSSNGNHHYDHLGRRTIIDHIDTNANLHKTTTRQVQRNIDRNDTTNTSSDSSSTIIPGVHHQMYGSLQDSIHNTNRFARNVAASSWQAADNADVQRVTVKAMIYELIHQQTATIEQTVPWFLETMPSSYFRQVPEWLRMEHIKAIAAVKDANMDLYLNLSTHLHDGRQVLTFIRPGTEAGTLLKMVQELPENTKYDDESPLSRLHVFSTADESMSLNMFIYGRSKPTNTTIDYIRDVGAPILQYAADLQRGVVLDDNHTDIDQLHAKTIFEPDELEDYMKHCTETYIRIGSDDPKRFLQQRQLVDHVSGTDGTAVHIAASNREPGYYWVDFAVANSLPQVALENLVRLLYVHQFDVARARLDIIPDDKANDGSNVIMLRTLVAPVPGSQSDTPETFQLLAHELKRSKWLDPLTHNLVFMEYPELGVTRGELITGFCHVIHPVLAKINALAYSSTNILETVANPRFIGHASTIADLFLDRFHPKHPLSEPEFQQRCIEISQLIDSDVEDRIASEILLKMIDIVKHTLKTNVYMPDRYALGLRLDPKCMIASTDDVAKELPYGVLFVHGRRFNGFHVRFRDISRGGLRLVTPTSAEQFALESSRHYDECYGLAYAQQLKNKDIPEGGSKAVNLINTTGLSEKAKNFVMRKSVKAMTDTILDLIVDTPYTRQYTIDLFGKPEVLYLGPDEQVIPEDIEWIVKRAAERGYTTPAAFMSSKPKAGINHKQYGVTSEGVNVYLEVALQHVLGINPRKDSFTVKMTGGPDGDVAGNEIKILIREYGTNVKFVGIADHSGCAEDPNGLDHDELLRLFHEGKCIKHFDPTKLSHYGALHQVDTPAGVKARNTMHNRLEADAFVPCGGRPNTIDINNYRQFLKPDGTPSSRLIVEGANLFVTAEARLALFQDAGVSIVKDSSANKGGVITSSYEICAAMLLSEDEFFAHKEQIVSEVLEKLRGMAKLEALLLFREFDSYVGSLPEMSQSISNCINSTTDALASALDTLSQDDLDSLLPLFRAHLPKTIADLAFDKVKERVPPQYIKNAIASCLASKIVYKEGTKFIESQPKDRLAELALKYIKKEKEVVQLMEVVTQSNLPDDKKDEILQLLEQGGTRTALQMLVGKVDPE